MPSDRGNPYLRANSLSELLSWNDVDFIRCAYVTVLGRQPDPTGEADFTKHLRSGTSKLEILWLLRKSSEGPSHDPGIAGFDRALKRAASQRRPIRGLVARLFKADADGNSRIDRALRALNNLSSVTEEHLRSINHKLDSVGGAHSTTTDASLALPGWSSSIEDERRAPPDQETSQFPKLDHLRNRSPLARYFQENAF